VLAALAWRRRGDPVARTLGAWALLGGAPLFVFYLHAPSVSSRYQLDLAPAIAALLVIAWRAAVTRWPRGALAVLVALWAGAVATSKITRPRGVSDPVDRDAAASSTYAITHAVAYDHALPPAYDHADPRLVMWLDVLDDHARCSDALGAPVACDAPALPGDTAVLGRRDGQRWILDRTVIPDEPAPEPVCRPPGDDGMRACPAAPTIASDPAAVHDEVLVGPPTLYLNGFGWDLATLRVPPATLFYVEDPGYLALDVTGPPGTDWEHEVRAVIDREPLRLVAAADTATGARLRFAVGRHPGLQIAFVAFGPDRELDRPQSRLGLRSIRWRD
jgi:hypothetical protein